MADPPSFPGMNPYLEGHLWPDVHQSLIQTIRELLATKIAPKYVIHVEPYVVLDTTPESELGILYPDLAVLKPRELKEPASEYGLAGVTNPDLVLPAPAHFAVRIPRLVVKRRDGMQAVTVVEILSPVNKKEPGLRKYLKKRASLYNKGVHFLEIDLLRRGQHTVDHPQTASADYLVQLLRAGSGQVEIWTVSLPMRLPVVPVPLLPPDADVALDVQAALNLATERGLYHLSVDYTQDPPPPTLNPEQKNWLKTLTSP